MSQTLMETHLQNEQPCFVCGGTAYTWGSMSEGAYWKDKNRSQLRHYKTEAQVRMLKESSLRTRLCNNCGNVQLFDYSHPIEGTDWNGE